MSAGFIISQRHLLRGFAHLFGHCTSICHALTWVKTWSLSCSFRKASPELLSTSHWRHMMAPKPTESEAVGEAGGGESITSGLWGPAPWPGTLSAPEDTGSKLNTPAMGCWQGNPAKQCPSALLQDSAHAGSQLNWIELKCWINSRGISEVGSGISHLSESFHFSALFPLRPIRPWYEGLHLHISGATYLWRIEMQFRSETCLEMTLAVSTTQPLAVGMEQEAGDTISMFCTHGATLEGVRKGAIGLWASWDIDLTRHALQPRQQVSYMGILPLQLEWLQWAVSYPIALGDHRIIKVVKDL